MRNFFCGAVRGCRRARRRVVKSDNELGSPVFELRFREVKLFHGPAHCRDTGIPVFCPRELFRHHSQSGIAQFRFRIPELFHAHSAVKAAGAVHLKTIREKIKLHGGAFRVRAVIPVDQGIEHSLADCLYGIFRAVVSASGPGVDDRPYFHVPETESHSLVCHAGDSAFDAAVVEETHTVPADIAYLCAGYGDCRDAELRVISLWIDTEVHDGSQSRLPRAGDIQQLAGK